MKISILTLFPEMFDATFNQSIIKRAREKNLVEISLVNIRDFATDTHKTVDDRPYGGGVGMILRVDILHKALSSQSKGHRILLSPKGKKYTQMDAKRFSRKKHLVFICGHYEGVDSRIENYVDEIISIGDFVLTGGEIPAMAITDSIVRLLPGVLPAGAVENESFEQDLFEYPQYTRPETFRGQKVPKVLLSGNHAKIANWRKSEQKKVTTSLLKRGSGRVC